LPVVTTSRWSDDPGVSRGDDYDARWHAMAEAGEAIHGEVDFVMSFEPSTVLDAGCGTGRVAIELAHRGREVVGVDLDPSMLDAARRNGSDLTWIEADLHTVDLGRVFDAVVMAGNVMIFVRPGTERPVVAALASHVAPGGVLIAGFQLADGSYDLARYDADCEAAGLVLAERHATWDREPFVEGGTYAVSVHRNP
jgi:SAM-dependent methyltransferase